MWLQVNMINNLTKECDFSIANLYLISEKKLYVYYKRNLQLYIRNADVSKSSILKAKA